jgi:hypothetical protein
VFRVVDDDHALAPIPLDTSQQALPDQLLDRLVAGKLVDRRQRTEPVEHVIARVKQHESPDAERGGTRETHAASGTFPTELRRKSERDRNGLRRDVAQAVVVPEPHVDLREDHDDLRDSSRCTHVTARRWRFCRHA